MTELMKTEYIRAPVDPVWNEEFEQYVKWRIKNTPRGQRKPSRSSIIRDAVERMMESDGFVYKEGTE